MTTSRPEENTMLCTVELIHAPDNSSGDNSINRVSFNFRYRKEFLEQENQELSELKDSFGAIREMMARYKDGCCSSFFNINGSRNILFLIREKSEDSCKTIITLKKSGITTKVAIEALDYVEDEVKKLAKVPAYYRTLPRADCCMC